MASFAYSQIKVTLSQLFVTLLNASTFLLDLMWGQKQFQILGPKDLMILCYIDNKVLFLSDILFYLKISR